MVTFRPKHPKDLFIRARSTALGRFSRSLIATPSVLKQFVFLYEKLGGPVTEMSVFATEILVTEMKMLVPI